MPAEWPQGGDVGGGCTDSFSRSLGVADHAGHRVAADQVSRHPNVVERFIDNRILVVQEVGESVGSQSKTPRRSFTGAPCGSSGNDDHLVVLASEAHHFQNDMHVFRLWLFREG